MEEFDIIVGKMDEEMITLENVMSVDLAIRRELLYRRKIEVLTAQNNQTHFKSFASLQEPSQAGRKRKAAANNSSPQACSSSQAFQIHPPVLVCEICKLAFSTLFHIQQHCESLRHKAKIVQMRKMGELLGNLILCKLCKAPCSSCVVLEQHLSGAKHTQALQNFEDAKRTSDRLLSANHE